MDDREGEPNVIVVAKGVAQIEQAQHRAGPHQEAKRQYDAALRPSRTGVALAPAQSATRGDTRLRAS